MTSLEHDEGQVWSYAQRAMAGRPPTREAPPFGKRLAALREQKGLTQVQFAEALGIAQPTVAYYERRAENPSLGFIENVAKVLNVDVVELVGEPSKRGLAAARPGPRSQLDERFEKVRRLPKAKQALVVRMIDAVLADSG